MTVISIQQAQERLSELIRDLTPGDELLITENDQPVARLVKESPPERRTSRRPGTLRGTVTYMAPDFDAPLDDFREYME